MLSSRFGSANEVMRSCLPIRVAVLQPRSSSRWTGSLSRRRSGPSHSGLIRSLLPHDLIDEYRLLVYPLVLGKGKRLFDESSAANLKLAESAAFDTGVVKLVYRPANMPRDVVRVPPNPDPRPRRHEPK